MLAKAPVGLCCLIRLCGEVEAGVDRLAVEGFGLPIAVAAFGAECLWGSRTLVWSLDLALAENLIRAGQRVIDIDSVRFGGERSTAG